MVTTNDINYLEIANQLGWICKDIGNDQILFSHPLEKSGEYRFTANGNNIPNSVYINKCALIEKSKELNWRVNTRSLDQYVLSTNTPAGNYGFSLNYPMAKARGSQLRHGIYFSSSDHRRGKWLPLL